jgi:hypothetical protein
MGSIHGNNLYMDKEKVEYFRTGFSMKKMPLFGLTNGYLNSLNNLPDSANESEVKEALGKWVWELVQEREAFGKRIWERVQGRNIVIKRHAKIIQPKKDWSTSLTPLDVFRISGKGIVAFRRWEKDIKKGETEKPSIWYKNNGFYKEYQLVQFALKEWLIPTGVGRRRETPSQKFSEIYNTNRQDWRIERIKRISSERNRQFTSQLLAVDVVTSRWANQEGKHTETKLVFAECYTSGSLIPLVWAEILHAVKNDIFARPCVICGQWFPLKKGKYNQIYCSIKCQSEAKRKSMQAKREEIKARKASLNNLPLLP